MSLQVCHCGWSKRTTYQGLRTHQGMKGCTPKGMSIPQSDRYLLGNFGFQKTLFDSRLNTPIKVKDPIPSPSDWSLQVCHCGWSKLTSYQGLRIHQGKMGCTPKGMRIPQSDQHLLGNTGLRRGLFDSWPDLNVPNKAEETRALENGQYPWINMHEEKKIGHHRNTSLPHTQLPLQLPESIDTKRAPQETKQEDLFFFSTPSQEFQKFTNLAGVRRTLDFTSPVLVDQIIRDRMIQMSQEDTARLGIKRSKQVSQERTKADLKQKVRTREQKLADIKASVKDYNHSLDWEWLEINAVFSEVLTMVEQARADLLQPLQLRRQEIKQKSKKLIQELQREIVQLEDTIAGLENHSVLQTQTQQVSPPPPTDLNVGTDWQTVTGNTASSFSPLRATLSAMMEDIQHKLDRLSAVELKRIQKFAVDVKLDSNTAHARLIVTGEGREVRDAGETLGVRGFKEGPKEGSKEAFDLFAGVLGQPLSSGCSYWEVEVGNKLGWDLGVAEDGAGRRGKLQLSPKGGYWVLVHYEGRSYAAMTDPPLAVRLKIKPRAVGVFVDRQQGLVSFYDVEEASHIHSFTKCCFSGDLRPYLSPHFDQDHSNTQPLVLSHVNTQ